MDFTTYLNIRRIIPIRQSPLRLIRITRATATCWILRKIPKTFRCFLRHSVRPTRYWRLCVFLSSGSTSLLPRPRRKKQGETETFGATLSASDATRVASASGNHLFFPAIDTISYNSIVDSSIIAFHIITRTHIHIYKIPQKYSIYFLLKSKVELC